MKKVFIKILSAVVSVAAVMLFTVNAAAEGEKISLKEHFLTIELSDAYTVLDSSNVSKNEEVVEKFGYTVSSFKNYLQQNNILFFGVDSNGTQCFLKCWQTDFSKEITDLSVLDDETLKSVATQIITISEAAYKTATVNGMRFFEVSATDTDSGGNFYSVQYITIRNGKIYSLNFAFPGTESKENKAAAWETVTTLKIEDKARSSPWDMASVFELVLIWAIIIVAVAGAVVIIISFVRDIKARKNESQSGTETIMRRKK